MQPDRTAGSSPCLERLPRARVRRRQQRAVVARFVKVRMDLIAPDGVLHVGTEVLAEDELYEIDRPSIR